MDLYLLNLKKSIKDPLIGNNSIKANIFIIKFFSKTRIVNFSNITKKAIILRETSR